MLCSGSDHTLSKLKKEIFVFAQRTKGTKFLQGQNRSFLVSFVFRSTTHEEVLNSSAALTDTDTSTAMQ